MYKKSTKFFLALVILIILALNFILASQDVLATNACIGVTANYTCGDIITQSCTLNGSISLSGGNCFDIGANDIFINGNGYTIDGTDSTEVGVDTNGYDNINISNLVMTDLGWSIYSDTSDNIKITNINVSSGSQLVFGKSSTDLNITNSNCNGVTNCILLETTTNSYFSNINIDTCSDVGLYPYLNSDNNIWQDSTITNCVYGIYDEQSNNNNFTNLVMDGTGTYGFVFDASIGSILKDSTITGQTYDIVSVNSYTTPPNNTILNVSFDDAKSTANAGEHHVKWYVDVYVNTTLGANLETATVTGKDKDNNQIFLTTTNSIGHITRQEISEYKETSAGKVHYNNYTFTATKTNYDSDSESVNITANTLDKIITLTLNYNKVEDLSGNSNDGTAQNGCLVDTPAHITNRTYFENGLVAPYLFFENPTAMYESTLTFDGIDDCVSINDSPELRGNPNITVSAWVKLDSYNSVQDFQSVIAKYGWGVNKGGFMLGMGNIAGGLAQDGTPTFMTIESQGYDTAIYNIQMPLNEYHLLTGTYDGTNIKFYYDGILKNTTPFSSNMNSTGEDLEIGRNAEGNDRELDGQIKNFQVYNKILSDDEVYTLYLNGQPSNNELIHNTNWTNVNGSMKTIQTNQSYFYKLGTGQTHNFGNVIFTGPGKTSTSSGLYVNAKDNLQVSNCKLNYFGYGIELTGDYDNNVFDSCEINNTNYGVYFKTGYKTYPTATNITNSEFNSNNYAIMFEPGSGFDYSISNSFIQGNTISNSDNYGIYLQTTIEDIFIYNNNFNSNPYSIYSDRTINNEIKNNVFSTDTISIRTRSETNLTIQNNTFNSATQYAFYSEYYEESGGQQLLAYTANSPNPEQNTTIKENTFNSNDIAIYLGNEGFNLTNNNFSSNVKATILPIFCSNDIYSNNKDDGKPIMFYNSNNTLIENINSYGSLIFCGGTNITLRNVSISDTTNALIMANAVVSVNNNSVFDNNSYSIYSDYSTLEIYDSTIQNSKLGLYSDEGSLFEIKNSIFSSNIEDIQLISSSQGTAYSSIITNVKVSADATSTFNKKWYLTIHVNNTGANPEEGANVTIYDTNDNLITSQLTDENGTVELWVDEISIASGITTEYNPYEIHINNGVSGNISNITITSNKTHSVTLTEMSCDSIILYSTKLYQNYSCTGDGFSIEVDNITFDCNGYKINGDGGTGSWGNPDEGIKINGKDGVTIKNCIIKDFDAGIVLTSTTPENSIIQDNTIQNTNLYGIGLWSGANSATIQNNILENGDGHGIMLTESITGGTISHNSIDNFNGTGYGISLDNSNNIQIYNNNVTNSYVGVLFGNKTNATTAYNNILDGNDYNLMLMYDATNNNIYDNTFTNSVNENIYLTAYDIITLKPSSNILSSNTISNSGATDIKLYYAENNTIKDLDFDDISLENSPNTILLNATYTTINFVDASTSYIYRKWYMNFYVNDSIGNNVSNAKIEIDNSDDSNQLTIYTPSNGEVSANVSEYKQDGTTTTNYALLNISVSRTGFISDNKIIDLSTNTNVNFTLGCTVLTVDNNYINEDTAICYNTYAIEDSNSNGLIIINATNITFDCNDAILTATSGKAITINGKSGVTIQNCDLRNYEWGIYDYATINLSNEYINNSFSEIRWPMIIHSNYNTFSGNQFTSTSRKTSLPIEIKSCTNIFANNQINNKDINYYEHVIFEIETPLRIEDETTKGQYILCDVHNSYINNITITDGAGIYLIDSEPTITNSIITNSYYGIYADSASYTTAYDNNFNTNEIGIRLFGSGSNIYDNNFTTNKQYAFYITNCNNTFATSNLADGKVLKFTHNTTGSNIIDATQYSQIEYCNVNNSKITGTTMSAGSHGIILYNSNNVDINDSFIDSIYTGVKVYNSNYITIHNNTIDGNGIYAIEGDDSDYLKITNNDLTGVRGIKIYNSNNADINYNAVSSVTYNGIEFGANSLNGELIGNNITNSGDFGLFIRSTNGTYINNTRITGSGIRGGANNIDLYLRDSYDIEIKNTIITNIFNNERSVRIDGSTLNHFMHNIDTTNTIDGKTIRYLTNTQNQVIPVNPGYVGIINSTNITLSDAVINQNGEGVLIAYSSNITISATNLTNNTNGLEVYDSNITLDDLRIGESDSYGIYLYDSVSSTIIMTDTLSCGAGTKDIYNLGYLISSATENYCDSHINWDDDGGNISNPFEGTGCRHSCYSPKWKDLPTVEFYEDNNYTIDLSNYCDSYYTTSISFVGQDKSGITILENGSIITINPSTSWTGWENTTFNATNSEETVDSRNILEFNIIEVSPPIYTLNLTNTSLIHNITIDWEDINGEAGYTIYCANSIDNLRTGTWVSCGSIDENSTTWTDINATNYNTRYYKVASKTARDVNKLGALVVGKLNYEFNYNVDGNVNIFALPLYKTSLITLEDLYNEIDDTSATLYYFNPVTQDTDTACYYNGTDVLCNLMDLINGSAYILLTDGIEPNYTLGGEVPDFKNITLIKPCNNESQWNCSGRNYVGVAVNSTITTPSAFMDAIEAATSANVKSITYLNSVTQEKQAKIDIGLPFDLGTNFDILPGVGYEIELDVGSAGSFIWMQS